MKTKEMTPCRNCGTLMSAASEMCTACCQWVHETPANVTKTTTNIKANSQNTTAAPQNAPVAAQKPIVPPLPSNQIQCTNCGERVFSLDTKCPKCGTIPRGEFKPRSDNKTVLTVVGIIVAAILVLSTIIIVLVKSDIFKSSSNTRDHTSHVTTSDDNRYYEPEAVPSTTDTATTTITYPDDERRTFATNTWLRSSPSKSGDGNKLELVEYGTVVTQLSTPSNDWTNVKINSTGNVGYMATEFLLAPTDYLKINSFFSSKADREKLTDSKYRLALRAYATSQKTAGYNDSEAQSYLNSLGYSKTELINFSIQKLRGTKTAGIYRFSNNTVVAYLFDSNSNDSDLIGICATNSFNGVSDYPDEDGDYYIQSR